MNMDTWCEEVIKKQYKKPFPILSFPAVQLMDVSVQALTHDATLQAEAMCVIANRLDSLGAVSFMDLSVESEAFGSMIKNSDDEVPTVVGKLVSTMEEVEALCIPAVSEHRTALYVKAIQDCAKVIVDRPIFAGCIGPFSLAGRLMGVEDAMVNCFLEPDMVHVLMKKCSTFITSYIQALKAAGANGIVMAEPLAGLLSPALMRDFSNVYIKDILKEVQDETCSVIYHNCGPNVVDGVSDLANLGAKGYHFGNAIDIEMMLKQMPKDVLIMGNLDPVGYFKSASAAQMREATQTLLDRLSCYPNFVASSGCDIPPTASWDNIHVFFDTVNNRGDH